MSDPFDIAVDVTFRPPEMPVPNPATLLRNPVRIVGVGFDLSAGLDLPGIKASAEHFGAAVELEFRGDRSGNLLGGFLALAGPTAYGPKSITLALTPPLPGGGRIEQVNDNLYRGAIGVDLGVVVIAGFASVQLSDPLSIVAILSGSFRPPIQLSFGFTLVGVGGVVGINRRFDRDGISKALSSGDLGNMLFPTDPVGQADTILPALDKCFPVSRDDFFVGPMLKIGWATPTIVSATVGIIVGTDGVIIVGQVRLSLPCEDAPFALFNIIVLGLINAEGVSIDGSLVNSRIGPVTLEGDARFRLTKGKNGAMALSVGGFHPHYTPPPGMEGMKRIAAEMSPLPFASMRLEGYTALTSDSVQLGGKVMVRVDFAVAAVDGHAQFDAIIFFSPFHFRADFSASLSLELFGARIAGVSVTADFMGPGHWELNGSVDVEILWWDVNVDLHLDWGDALPEPLATDDPVALVTAQLQDRASWSVADDTTAQRMVLMGDSIAGAAVPMSPLGPLHVVQLVSPLGVEINRFGGRRLPKPMTLQLDGSNPGNSVMRGFPQGLFFQLEESKLSANAALVDRQAGQVVAEAALVADAPQVKQMDFEDALLTPLQPVARLRRSGIPHDLFVAPLITGGAAARRRDAVESATRAPRFTMREMSNG